MPVCVIQGTADQTVIRLGGSEEHSGLRVSPIEGRARDPGEHRRGEALRVGRGGSRYGVRSHERTGGRHAAEVDGWRRAWQDVLFEREGPIAKVT
jgi:hypothetical protein